MSLEMAVDAIPDFFRRLFYPTALGSLQDSLPSGEITVILHTSPAEPSRELTIKNIFPFMTLQDIKLAIYMELKQEDYAIPEFVYLCKQSTPAGLKHNSIPIDYTWNDPTLQGGITFRNSIPFNLATGKEPLDKRFVESTGDRKLMPIVTRERLSIEDAFLKGNGIILKGIPEFHVYFYRDLLEAIPGAKPPSEKDWNGRLYPFFPLLSVGITQPTAEHKAKAKRMATIFSRRQQFLMRLQSLLDDNVSLTRLTLAAVKYLVLVWPKEKSIPGIEAQFYEAAANERRPFIRLIPADGTSISKIYLKDGKNPDIQDPKMLLSWAQERNPTPERDYAFAKILLRRGVSNLPSVYATLSLLNDGTAKCIVEPPKPMKKLEPRTDLDSFGEHLLEGLEGLPYITGVPEIYKASLVLGVRLKKDAPPITSRMIRERLPVFTSFFQEIAALPGEKPLIMLRYKLVSNFANEDRIQTFITQVMNRKIIRGEGLLEGLIELVADEFQMDVAEARKHVAKKLQIQSEVALVNPDSKDYMHEYNPGIDVGFFAQHPFYTFHLHRVNSVENLQRIITAISLMISAEPSDLVVSAKAVKELAKAEQVEAVEEAKEIAEELAPVPEAAAAAAADVDDAGSVAGEGADYLDFFAFGEDEQAADAAAQEGTPYPEVPSAEEQKPAPPVPVAAAPPVEELKRAIGEAVEKPKVELAQVAEVEAEEEEPPGEISIANYFLRKLQEADSALFDYHKSNPALKRYVSKCQPTHGRQPAVMNEEQFQRMEEEYKDEAVFQVYPLEPGEPEKPAGNVERDYYTVLRYGTTPQKQNYYICCRYFCIKDGILVREVDLKSTKMRRPKGADKKSGQCPFCKGTVIENQKSPRPTDTILERAVKPKTDQRHLYIRFMKSTPHPDGFYLPCCFLDESPVKFSDPAYDKYRQWGLPGKLGKVRPVNKEAANALKGAEEEDDEEEDEKGVEQGPRQAAGIPIMDYYVIMASVTRKYIIGAEKFPLEVPIVDTGVRDKKKTYAAEAQVGLLPPVLDSYFDQDQTQLVSRSFNPQKIKPDGEGFLRIGVENRVQFQADSFLAAIAPFYMKNSAEQMKELLDKKITARIFMAMNYGNAVLEFYDPSTSERPTDEVIDRWADDELEIQAHRENREALVRAYLSYHAFKEWLKSDTTKKEFRHFALILAQANLIRDGIRPGITFIVLDILKSGEMSVRCPPMGYNADLMAANDIGFLLRHWSGIWEPIFYVDARKPGERGLDNFILTFQMARARDKWPPIVKKRVQEYAVQCSSIGRSIYTSQSAMNPMSMIPCSAAYRILRKEKRISLEGIVRDAYNHIGALLFKEKTKAHVGYIALPVIDDGEMIVNKKIMLDWDDPEFERPPVDIVLQFYKTYVEGRFELYPGFSPIRLVRSASELVAIQLRNGLYVPVNEPTEEAADIVSKMPSVPVDDIEWAINHEIALGGHGKVDDLPGKSERMKVNEFHEVFEHLRLTFSNWLVTAEGAGSFRETLNDVIFSRKLPLFEKRKRLKILIEPFIRKWITTDGSSEGKNNRKNVSLMRVDCRIRSKETCIGRCSWKRVGEEDKCLLHAPKTIQLGEQQHKHVSSANVLLLRLVEELLRYGERRRQILEQEVNRVVSMDNAIMIEGNQKIYPEKSAAWYELLRLEWATQKEEQPRFYEEMAGAESDEEEEVVMPPPKVDESMLLPPRLETLINGKVEDGVDVKTAALRLFRAPLETLFVPLGLTPAQFKLPPDTTIMPEDVIRDLVRIKEIPIVQINLQVDPPTYIARKPARPTTTGVPVFVATMEGPALLMLNPSEPNFLKRAEMPRGLGEIVDKAKTMLTHIQKKPAPPPA